MKPHPVTIKDIARELGVSPSTVSRALKDHPDISEETRRVVKELADRLKYKPNAIALSLKNRKSNVVGVIIPQIVHYFFSSVISGIDEVATKYGYSVMIAQSNELFDKEVEAMAALADGRIDGLLISISKETVKYDHFRQFKEEGIEIVFFDRIPDDFKSDSVVIDDFQGALKAVQHLIDGGHKRILHLAGPQTRLIGRKRLKGYLQALENNHIPFDEKLVVSCDTFDKALEKMPELVSSGLQFDAVFTVNDFTAAGVIQSLKLLGKLVPDDMAVVGYGDDDIAKMIYPTLTTIRQPGKEMGIRAMEMLHKRLSSIEENTEIVSEVLQAELVQRNSSLRV
ncbi:LacI family DNA-binding transcriptional regulator [Williamwhitmania taraxaci]|uniref:Transcriptional regulator, LacI family n=1 Tax=Williamwhitmania taraxaci TaxID=1640674 RepID=A0A1G6HTU7_9BACT|nr:LacI family DNA-binding transcriptional regulator [Williamwhitmania taraxaci]SDB97624.1 transcriptional regulator, LacI family [Williamwhitmania taraxaci]